MPMVVGIRFRQAGKLYHFMSGSLALQRLDKVVVETPSGLSLGRVVTQPHDRPTDALPSTVRRVVRKATEQDIQKERVARAVSERALETCRERVRAMRLRLRPVEADASMDGGRVTITFTADERVDFRALVRDLSAELRCRVDLRQVGARDEAKAIDGIGPCGQRLCCSRWLTEFQPISIKMAKLQNLALNPGKLAGSCGRLKCCLRYEIENYEGAQRELPPLGAKVFTVDGEARVVAVNVLERKVSLLFDDPTPRWFPADEVLRHNGCQEGIACGSGRCQEGGACGAEARSAEAPVHAGAR